MKAWQLHDFGLNNLRLGEAPTPAPKDDEVLICWRLVGSFHGELV